jgi:hypothetical protein
MYGRHGGMDRDKSKEYGKCFTHDLSLSRLKRCYYTLTCTELHTAVLLSCKILTFCSPALLLVLSTLLFGARRLVIGVASLLVFHNPKNSITNQNQQFRN